MGILSAAQWILAAPVIAIFFVFNCELALGLLPLRRGGPVSPRPCATAILIPAHNEAKGIAQTVSQIKALLPSDAFVLVVADNCTDDTAERARISRVRVVERNDLKNRGKGFALDFGRTQLAASPPECVIILDADCVPVAGTIEALIAAASETGTPVQSVNLMRAGAEAGPMVEISNFAFLIKNLVRQRGLVRSGGPAILTGTGMAFPWAVFERLTLASSNIVEDLAITVALTRDGTKPVLVEAARVWSEAATAKDTLTQRTRWEHGFVSMALAHAVPVIASGIAKFQLASVRLGLHLLVPPLALLFCIGFATLLVLGALALSGADIGPAIVVGAMMSASVLLLAIAWWREGRALLTARAILRIPLYVVWKIPVYLKLVRGAETEWVRTTRQD